MKDWANTLIPLGALGGIGLLAFAMIHTARAQRRAKTRLLTDFAHQHGLRYRDKDDGTAREFAQDFDGLGRFRSSSAGEAIPTDVVTGRLHGAESIFFRHHIRLGEGWGREWLVAGISADHPLAGRCAVQFCRRRTDKSSMYLQDPVLKELRIGTYNLVVRAASPVNAGRLADESVLEQLGHLAAELAVRPEMQVRDNRIAAYAASRNATIEDMTTLNALHRFVARFAAVA